MKIIFIADFFVEQILGGGELNNDELLKMLAQDGHEVLKINSHQVTPEFIDTLYTSMIINICGPETLVFTRILRHQMKR